MFNAGFAYLGLVPTFKGLEANVRAGIVTPLGKAGREGGEAASKGLLSSLGSAAGKIGGLLAAGFVTEKVTSFFAGSISAASDLSESVSKNQVVFGAASQGVIDFADSAATALGQTKAQALEATGVFGNLLRAVGLTEEQSSEMSTSFVTLASDLASFNNTSPTEALDALRAGLVGETEPLKRFGVNLNEAALKQKALSLGLSDGKGVLDANAKAQAAYALIMEQTSLAQGDFERTSGGLANQQRILSARFGDLQAKVGAFLLPALTALATFATGTLLPGLESVGAYLGSVLGPIFSAVGDTIRLFIGSFTGEGADVELPWMNTVIDLAGRARDAVDTLVTWVSRLWEVVSGLDFGSAFGVVQDVALPALTALVGVTGFLVEHFDTLVPLLLAGGAAFATYRVASAVETAFVGLTSAGRGVIATFAAVNAVAATQGVSSFTAFRKILVSSAKETRIFTAVQGLFNAVMAVNPIILVATALAALTAAVVWAYQNVEWFRTAVDAAWDGIQKAASWAWEHVLKPIFDHWQIALTVILGPLGAFVWAVTSHWDKIRAVVGWVWSTVLQPVFKGIWTWIQNNLIPAMGYLWDGVQAVWGGIATAVSWAWENVLGPVFGFIWSYINDQLVPGAQLLWAVAQEVFQGIASVVSWAWEHGIKPSFDLIMGGISAVAGWFSEQVAIIVGVFSVIGSALYEPFRVAFNAIATAWNATVGRLSFHTPDIPGTDWGGLDIEVPDIPTFHRGGRVPGRAGQEMLARLEGGEHVLSRNQVGDWEDGGLSEAALVRQMNRLIVAVDRLADRPVEVPAGMATAGMSARERMFT